ncbi:MULTISPECIES: hypothetical protein [unclassified Pseudomonas]|nr:MULTISPECIES: hypothetical protein [unclassified Pseudomonas]
MPIGWQQIRNMMNTLIEAAGYWIRFRGAYLWEQTCQHYCP